MSVFEVQYIDHIVLRVKAMERSIGVVEAGFYDRRGFVQGPSGRNSATVQVSRTEDLRCMHSRKTVGNPAFGGAST